MQLQKASAVEKMAGAKERFTRSVANVGLSDERAARAVDDRASAALDRAKAIKELEAIDDERIIKYLDIVHMMEKLNQSKEKEIKSDDLAIAAEGQTLGEIQASTMSRELTGKEPV